jgi:type III secretion protein T
MSISSVRLMACLRVSVFFSQQYITGIGRNVCVVSLTLLVFPITFPKFHALTEDMTTYFLIVGKEVFVGTMIGMFGNFIFYVAQGMGFIIDTQRGSTMASVMNPLSEEQTSPLGNLLMLFAVALCMTIGAVYVFLEGIYGSFQAWPVEQLFPTFKPVMPSFFLQQFGDDFMQQLAALVGPVIFLLFLCEFGLGMVARFAPQLNVFFLAMPVKSAMAVFFLILYLPNLTEYFEHKFWFGDKIKLLFKIVVPSLLDGS